MAVGGRHKGDVAVRPGERALADALTAAAVAGCFDRVEASGRTRREAQCGGRGSSQPRFAAADQVDEGAAEGVKPSSSFVVAQGNDQSHDAHS